MWCAGTVTAQFIAGKATRDALFLDNLDVTSLPAMVMVTAAVSIALVVVTSRGLRRISPAILMPAAFALSALLLLLEWALLPISPRAAAVAVYLQISGIGPILGSGFWLIASERFDPRTAKRRFGQIAGVGTLGGLLGALLTERAAALFGTAAMLPVLALLNLLCAWQLRVLAAPLGARTYADAMDLSPELVAPAPRSGLRVLAEARHLRSLAAFVLLSTIGAALVDYLFRAQAVAILGRGEDLLRFFAIFYAAASLVTFVMQASASRLALERLGLGATTGSPALALAVTGVGGLVAPGLEAMMIARGSESILRGSLFRAGYELFYTPVPKAEKRAAKSLIDVGVDRFGEATGGALIMLVLLVAPAQQYVVVLSAAILCSLAAVAVASRLNRAYIQTLERSLLNRALEVDLSEVEDTTTRTAMLRTLSAVRTFERRSPAGDGGAPAPRAPDTSADLDPLVRQIVELRSRDRDRTLRVLQTSEGVPAALVPHVLPLLAWDPVADAAVDALRRVAEERVGELVDALIDPNQDFAVRRRLARVFSVCVSQRAVDGLLWGLEDQRFEVRFQSARSLTAIREKNPRVRIPRDLIFEVVGREVAVGRLVWESHRLLQAPDEEDEQVFVDEFVRERAGRSLAQVFTLLSLVLPADPLKIAFRGLHTDDQNLRGTALEYLEGVLPPAIRDRLWPFLEDPRPARRPARAREEILADLLRSNRSIQLNLEVLKQRAAGRAPHSPRAVGATAPGAGKP